MAEVSGADVGRRRRRGSVRVASLAPAHSGLGSKGEGTKVPAPAHSEDAPVAAKPAQRHGREKAQEYDALSATVLAFGKTVGIFDNDGKFVRAEELANRVAEFFGFPDGVRVTLAFADRFQGLSIRFQPKGRQPGGGRFPEMGIDLYPTDLDKIELSGGGGGVLP